MFFRANYGKQNKLLLGYTILRLICKPIFGGLFFKNTFTPINAVVVIIGGGGIFL